MAIVSDKAVIMNGVKETITYLVECVFNWSWFSPDATFSLKYIKKVEC